VILAFHGQFSDSKDMQSKTDLDAAANSVGAIVAYLDDLTGDWAEGCDCAQADALGVDDVGFANAVVDEIAAAYNVDQSRLFAAGFSIGGLFAQRVACDSSNRFEGVVSIASTMSVPLSTKCAPSDPVKVMVILGSEDPVFPWTGTSAGIFSVLSVDAMTNEWLTNNSCASTAVNNQSSLGALQLSTSTYATCEGGGAFILHRVEGGQHFWYPGTGALISDLIGSSNQ
jgi:polyhydroxybutyrate depolymerase